MDTNVLVRKGQHHNGKSGLLNRGGSENVITNGSTIVVNEGQCMIIVDQGAIVDVCAQPGAYTYDTSSEPSVFTGGLGAGLAASFEQFKARFTYGGVTAHDQRIYYFNTKDIIGNKYGTANPVPFRVVDKNIGLDVDIAIRCFGEYAYRISDPILFYKNVCGNVNSDYTRDRIENQLRTELLTALQPAFGKISDMGIRYSSVVNHTTDMANALNEVLSDSWGAKYGIVITAFGISSLKASEEDEKMIKELQKTAVFRDGSMAGDRSLQRRQHGRSHEGQCRGAGYDGCSQEPQRSGHGLLRNEYGTAGIRRRNRRSFSVCYGSAAAGGQDAGSRRLEVP